MCAPQGSGQDEGELRAQLAGALCALAEMHLAQVRCAAVCVRFPWRMRQGMAGRVCVWFSERRRCTLSIGLLRVLGVLLVTSRQKTCPDKAG